MAKPIIDLTAAELDALARDAWAREAEASLQQGLPVTYVEDGKVYRRWPDGRRECLSSEPVAVREARSGETLDDQSQQYPHRSEAREGRSAPKVMSRGERPQAPASGSVEKLRAAPANGALKGGSPKAAYVSGWRSGRRRDKANTADD